LLARGPTGAQRHPPDRPDWGIQQPRPAARADRRGQRTRASYPETG